MVKIPTFDKPIRAAGVREDVQAAGALGRGIQQTGQAAGGFVEKRTRELEHDNFTSAKNELRQFGIEQDKQLRTLQGGAAKGSTKSFQDAWKKKVSEVSNKYGGRVGNAVTEWGDEKGLSFLQSHSINEDSNLRAQGVADLKLEQSFINEELRQTGDLDTAMLDRYESYQVAVSAGHILKEDADRLFNEQVRRDRETAFDVAYARAPNEAMASIESFQLDQEVRASKENQYDADIKAAQREQDRVNREKAQVIFERSNGQAIIALETNDTTALRNDAEALRILGQDEKANAMIRQADAIDQSAAQRTIDSSKTLSDAATDIQAVEISKDPLQAEIDDTVRGQRIKEFNARLKAYNSDPAAFVATEVQGETKEQRAGSSLSLQAIQGVIPKNGYKVLTNQERAQLQGAFDSGGTREKTNIVTSIKRDYGKYGGQVLGELGISPGAMMTAYVDNESDQQTLMRAATEKVELPPGLKESDFKTAADDSDIVEVLEEARRLVPNDASYSSYMNMMRDTIANVGKLVGDHDKGVDWVEERFGSINDSDMRIIFPKAFIDEDEIEDRLDSKRQSFKAQFMFARDANEKAGWAVDNAVWINDGDGFSLIDGQTGMRFAGSQISFEELR